MSMLGKPTVAGLVSSIGRPVSFKAVRMSSTDAVGSACLKIAKLPVT